MTLVSIFAWVMSSVGARVLISLGMGFVSYGAVTASATLLISEFSGLWGSFPTAVLQILSLAGFPTALGWIIGAYLARLALSTISKIGRVPV